MPAKKKPATDQNSLSELYTASSSTNYFQALDEPPPTYNEIFTENKSQNTARSNSTLEMSSSQNQVASVPQTEKQEFPNIFTHNPEYGNPSFLTKTFSELPATASTRISQVSFALESPEETKTTRDNFPDIDSIIRQIQAVGKNVKALDELHQLVQKEELSDPDIYNALIIAAFHAGSLDRVASFFNELETSLKMSNLQTYHHIIEISGYKKDLMNIDLFYDHIKKLGMATDETYFKMMDAYMHCGEPQIAWNFYETEVPAEVKATHWKIHEKIISMVAYFNLNDTEKNQATLTSLLRNATKAYNNAIAAKDLNVSYDVVHAKILEMAFNYNLFELARGIYNDACKANTVGQLTQTVYDRYKPRIMAKFKSEANLDRILEQPSVHGSRQELKMPAQPAPADMPTQSQPFGVGPAVRPPTQMYSDSGYSPATFQQRRLSTHPSQGYPPHPAQYEQPHPQHPSSNIHQRHGGFGRNPSGNGGR